MHDVVSIDKCDVLRKYGRATAHVLTPWPVEAAASAAPRILGSG